MAWIGTCAVLAATVGENYHFPGLTDDVAPVAPLNEPPPELARCLEEVP